MPPDPYAVIVLSLLLGASTIAVGLFGSGVILLTGCLKRKHSQKRAAGKTATANTDISGEAAEINSSGGGAVKSGGTPGSGLATTPAKPIKSITPVAVTPDKPGGSANSKTNHRVKGSHKDEVEGESHDVSGQLRDSETKEKQKASKELHKKSNQKILDEREDKIAKGLVVRRQSDYPAMDDILSDWDESDSPGKKSKKSKKEPVDGGGGNGGGGGTSREKKKDQTQLTRTRDK